MRAAGHSSDATNDLGGRFEFVVPTQLAGQQKVLGGGGTPMAPKPTPTAKGRKLLANAPAGGLSALYYGGPANAALNSYAPPTGHLQSIVNPIVPPFAVMDQSGGPNIHSIFGHADVASGLEIKAIERFRRPRSPNQLQ